jgi:hypothetical protein
MKRAKTQSHVGDTRELITREDIFVYPAANDPNYGEKMKELHEKLSKIEKIASPTNDEFMLMPHQSEATHFLNLYTSRRSCLFFYEMGSGKSILGIYMIETLKPLLKEHKTRAKILVPNKLIESVFEMELIGKFEGKYQKRVTGNEYMSAKMRARLNRCLKTKDSAERKKLEKIVLRAIREIYQIETHKKWEQDISKLTDLEIAEQYSNCVILVDELHKAKNPDSGFYNALERVLKLSRNTWFIGMTAKPLIDHPREFCQYINLCYKNEGMNKVLTPNVIENLFNPKKKNAFEVFRKATDGFVVSAIGHHPVWYPTRVDVGKTQQELNLQYANNLSSLLTIEPSNVENVEALADGYENDDKKILLRPVEMHSVQLEEYINSFMTEFMSNRDLDPNEMWNESRKQARGCYTTQLKMSAVFERIYNDAKEVQNMGPIVVYCFFVEEGMYWFEEFLQSKGVRPFQDSDIGAGERCEHYFNFARPYSNGALKHAIQICQSNKNKDGSIIRWILGTRKIGIGITITNAARVVSIGADWNEFSQDQFFGRCIRFGSHSKKNAIIQVIRYCVVITARALAQLPYMLREQFKKFIQTQLQNLLMRGFLDPHSLHLKSIDEYMYDIVWRKFRRINVMEKNIHQISMKHYNLSVQSEKTYIRETLESIFRTQPMWNVEEYPLNTMVIRLHEYVTEKIMFRGWQNQTGYIKLIGNGFYQFIPYIGVEALNESVSLHDFINPAKFIEALFPTTAEEPDAEAAAIEASVTSYFVPEKFKPRLFYITEDFRVSMVNDDLISGVFTNTPNHPNVYQFKVTSNSMESVCCDKSLKEINALAKTLGISLPKMRNGKCRNQVVNYMLREMIKMNLMLPWCIGERPTIYRMYRIATTFEMTDTIERLERMHHLWVQKDLKVWTDFIGQVLKAQELCDGEMSEKDLQHVYQTAQQSISCTPFYFYRLLDQTNTTRPKRFNSKTWEIIQHFRKSVRQRYDSEIRLIEVRICEEIKKRTHN